MLFRSTESTDFGIATTVDVPLSLSLVEFTGKNLTKTSNILNWTMGSELDGNRFIIERKGSSEDNFTQIGSINSYGNSSIFTYYSFVDDKPFDGLNYYRLKMVDVDGKINYSNVAFKVCGRSWWWMWREIWLGFNFK